MAKYQNNIFIAKTETGTQYYTTALPVEAEIPQIKIEYKSVLGDRWDTLAYKYLGDAKYWYVLAKANNGVNGSIFIKPGTNIILPNKVI